MLGVEKLAVRVVVVEELRDALWGALHCIALHCRGGRKEGGSEKGPAPRGASVGARTLRRSLRLSFVSVVGSK